MGMPYLPARGKGGAVLVKCKLKNDLICLESVLNQYPSVSFGKLGNTILQCSFADERAEPDPEKQYPGDMG